MAPPTLTVGKGGDCLTNGFSSPQETFYLVCQHCIIVYYLLLLCLKVVVVTGGGLVTLDKLFGVPLFYLLMVKIISSNKLNFLIFRSDRTGKYIFLGTSTDEKFVKEWFDFTFILLL